MQRPDESKRRLILDIATTLFAAKPYHEVRLDDVAAGAKLGKGTLYVYFASKEELYLTLVREGFSSMVAQAKVDGGDPGVQTWDRLRAVIAGLIRFANRYPDLYRVMRSGAPSLTPEDPDLQKTRRELASFIESVLREGVRRGELCDPHPGLTAEYVLSSVRGSFLYPKAGMTPKVLEDHMMRVLQFGLAAGGQP